MSKDGGRWVVSICERCGSEGRHPWDREQQGPDGWGAFSWEHNAHERRNRYVTSDSLRVVDHQHRDDTKERLYLCAECLRGALVALEGFVSAKGRQLVEQDAAMVDRALLDAASFWALRYQVTGLLDAFDKKPNATGFVRTPENALDMLRVLLDETTPKEPK